MGGRTDKHDTHNTTHAHTHTYIIERERERETDGHDTDRQTTKPVWSSPAQMPLGGRTDKHDTHKMTHTHTHTRIRETV